MEDTPSTAWLSPMPAAFSTFAASASTSSVELITPGVLHVATLLANPSPGTLRDSSHGRQEERGWWGGWRRQQEAQIPRVSTLPPTDSKAAARERRSAWRGAYHLILNRRHGMVRLVGGFGADLARWELIRRRPKTISAQAVTHRGGGAHSLKDCPCSVHSCTCACMGVPTQEEIVMMSPLTLRRSRQYRHVRKATCSWIRLRVASS